MMPAPVSPPATAAWFSAAASASLVMVASARVVVAAAVFTLLLLLLLSVACVPAGEPVMLAVAAGGDTDALAEALAEAEGVPVLVGMSVEEALASGDTTAAGTAEAAADTVAVAVAAGGGGGGDGGEGEAETDTDAVAVAVPLPLPAVGAGSRQRHGGGLAWLQLAANREALTHARTHACPEAPPFIIRHICSLPPSLHGNDHHSPVAAGLGVGVAEGVSPPPPPGVGVAPGVTLPARRHVDGAKPTFTMLPVGLSAGTGESDGRRDPMSKMTS